MLISFRVLRFVLVLCAFSLLGTACYWTDRYPRDNPWDPASTGDFDDDGIVNPEDNCPETANADQADVDDDSIGDACDLCIDADGDGYGLGTGCEDVDCDDSDEDIRTPACGDGNICGDEVCDDGFEDACGSCNASCSGPGSDAVCGDGNSCPELEACDDGGDSATCNDDCTLVACGDGYANMVAGEACDDGDTDDCTGDCLADCSGTIVITGCGDGVTCDDEPCDGAGQDTVDCNADCTLATCGDDYLNPLAGEVCDDGNIDDCTGDCLGDCSDTIVITGCGDGAVCGVEACDDGNTVGADYCAADCSMVLGACGDGVVLAALETCDDGALANSDGCSGECEVEQGFECDGEPSVCSVNPPPSRVSVGRSAACWIDGDPGPIRCWGFYGYNFDAPPGDFRQVVVAGSFSPTACALDDADEVQCWGSDVYPTPNDSFRQIAGVNSSWCGVTVGGEILCWGLADYVLPATGTFTRVAISDWGGCALRDDGTAVCFASTNDPGAVVTAPAGAVADVRMAALYEGSPSGRGACFLRPTGVVDCIVNEDEPRSFSELRYRFITPEPTDSVGLCGITVDDNVVCSGGEGGTSVPSATFSQIAAGPYVNAEGMGRFSVCGLDESNQPRCWGNPSSSLSVSPPDLVGDAVSIAYNGGFCVVNEGQLQCFDAETLPNETTNFLEVVNGGDAYCGLKDDGSLSCWGSNLFQQLSPPDNTYLDVTLGSQHGCGVTALGEVVCWGDDSGNQLDAPTTGVFTRVDAAAFTTCGLRDDGLVVCWGDNALTNNLGPFSDFANAGFVGCGINSSTGTVSCWPSAEGIEQPTGTFSTVVSAGDDDFGFGQSFFCGLQTTGEITCWGYASGGDGDGDGDENLALSGSYTALDMGQDTVCGVEETTRQIRCDGRLVR